LSNHPSLAELEGFLLNCLSPERTRFLILHLLRGCEHCRTVLTPFVQAFLAPAAEGDVQLSREQEAAYDLAIDRALRVVTPRSRRTAGNSLNSEEDEAGLIETLLDRSWALRYENPSEMVRLAQMASTLADDLGLDRHSPQKITEIRLRALTELGNAYRVADELDQANEVLDRAAELFIDATVSDRLSARYFDVLASLYGAYRLFEMARFALMIAHNTYSRLGDEHLAGRTLISLGIYTGYSGDPEEGSRLIRQGLAFIDEDRDPDLVFLGVQAQARFFLDCGRHREAKFVLWELKKRHPDPGGRVNELKVLWLEGQIYAGLEELERAEQALLRVREGFAEAGLPYKAALAGLELGAARLRQGRLAEGEEVVREAVEVFIALRIRREAMAAVLVLKKACEARTATAALIESVADFLRRAEEDPSLRFEARDLR
jgi:tetratricopeptide (TPR) repeat protein